jgi:DHA3 family macrolide efflux protein-like MFS transporter
MQPWHVFALMFVRAVGGGSIGPPLQASTSLMVPHEQISRVAGMNQTLQGAMRIVSPPLGALLVHCCRSTASWRVDVITAAIAIGPLLVFGIPQPERHRPPRTLARDASAGLFHDVADGFRYIWHGVGSRRSHHRPSSPTWCSTPALA